MTDNNDFPMKFEVSITVPKLELFCGCHVGGFLGHFGTDVWKLYDHIRLTSGHPDPEFETAQQVHISIDRWKDSILRAVDDGKKRKEGNEERTS
jgi:hypothetical protein